MYNKPKLFLILTLLFGFVLGASTVWLASRYKVRKFTDKAPVEKMFSRMDRCLDLDDKQEKIVREILERHSKEGKEIRERFYSDIEDLHSSVFEEIKPHLTEKQVKRYKKRRHRSKKSHHTPRSHRHMH